MLVARAVVARVEVGDELRAELGEAGGLDVGGAEARRHVAQRHVHAAQAAARRRLVHVGDQLVHVDGHAVLALAHGDAAARQGVIVASTGGVSAPASRRCSSARAWWLSKVSG